MNLNDPGLPRRLARTWYLPVLAIGYAMLDSPMFLDAGKSVEVLGRDVPFALTFVMLQAALSAVIGWLLLACLVPGADFRPAGHGASVTALAAASAAGIACGKLSAPGALFTGPARIALAACAGLFAFLVLIPFWEWLAGYLKGAAGHVGRSEALLYIGAVAAAAAWCAVFHSGTRLLWGTGDKFDMLFKFDSEQIMRERSWVSAMSLENGLHQPLFSIAAAPFAGLAYLPLALLGTGGAAEAAAYSAVQAALVLLGWLLLASAMGLSGRDRAWFMALACCSSSFLLYALVPEQYPVCFFWLCMLVHGLSRDGRAAPFAMLASVGGMVLSAISVALHGHGGDAGARAKASRAGRRCAIGLAAVMAVSGTRILYHFAKDFTDRIRFVGAFAEDGPVGVPETVRMWASMLADAFAVPPSVIADHAYTGQCVQAVHPGPYWLAGLAALALGAAGLWLHRRDAWARIAGSWLLAGFLSMGVIGYGAAEGGMSIYALYWGWPVVLGAAALAGRLSGRLPGRARACLASAACLLLLSLNIWRLCGVASMAVQIWPA